METETPLQALIAKYQRSHWEFAALDLSDINQKRSDDDTLIHLIACVGGADELDLLVRSGAKINAPGDLGHTPLHYAAMFGRFKIAQKLLALGADPNLRNEWGDTPMKTASNGGHADIAKLLKRCKYYK